MDDIPVQGRYRYYQPAYVVLPVGVVLAPDADGRAIFVHLRMTVGSFLQRYGSAEQVAEFATTVVNGYPKMHAEIFRDTERWSFFTSDEPVSKRVCLADDGKVRWRVADFASLTRGERGGYKRSQYSTTFHGAPTRAQRRKENGMPRHSTVEAKLSFNRAVETLLARAAHLRRAFYDEQQRLARFPRFNTSEAKTPPVKWAPPTVAHHLSGLVWDAKHGRPVANRYFSICRP